MTMPDDAGEDDERLMLDSIFPVSSYPHIIAISSHIPQEPPRPPSPEPTIAVYERSVIDDPTTVSAQTPWSTITVRLVGSHPLWGHYLCATFPSHENLEPALTASAYAVGTRRAHWRDTSNAHRRSIAGKTCSSSARAQVCQVLSSRRAARARCVTNPSHSTPSSRVPRNDRYGSRRS